MTAPEDAPQRQRDRGVGDPAGARCARRAGHADAARAVEGDLVGEVGALAVPAVGEDLHGGLRRAGGEVDGQLGVGGRAEGVHVDAPPVMPR